MYRATDPFIGRILAIKTFRVDLPPGPERDRFLQRFYHEARISGGLSHPNIVALFDVGEMDGLPYLVFEHVEGPTLEIALARAVRLDSAETIRVVEQAAGALDFAHARGVVHRDIRPANIILANDKRVRIADFGIARIEGSQLTQHGEILGTPAYMSPEQIRGYELSPSSDLFSLAVCAYEMLSGQRPFSGKDQGEMLEALVYSPPAEPKELRALGIPSRDFMFVFERALAKDPAHRFVDGLSFARALKSCLGVVVPGDDVPRVARIAIPEPPPVATRVILPPVAPKAPPPQPPAEAPSPVRFDTAATASIEGGSGGPSAEPKFISSTDATLISTAVTEAGSKAVPADLASEATLISSAPFDPAGPFPTPQPPPPPSSADATMVSSFNPGQDGESPAPRLTRQAVESILSKSSPAAPPPPPAPPVVLQKTLPGSDKGPLAASSASIEDLLPPTREMPKITISPSLSASRPGRDSPSSTQVGTLSDTSRSGSFVGPSDKTVLMTDTEKAAAAKLRIPDRVAPKPPVITQPPVTRALPIPSLPQTGSIPRGGISRPPAAPAVPSPQAASAGRSSMLPKILLAGVLLVLLLGLAVGAIMWVRASRSSAPVAEKWNDLPVYSEADVEKSPLLFSHELPRPKLEPGRVVSVTVSWIVTPEGLVDDPKIVVSASTEIDAFVIEAVRKWRYEPGQKDGKTVPVRVLRKYTFPQRGSSEG